MLSLSITRTSDFSNERAIPPLGIKLGASGWDIYWKNKIAKQWKPVIASCSGPPICHLFFAGDDLLFGEASINQIIIVKQCLNNLCTFSEQRVNYEKSKLYCSPNTYAYIAQNIAHISGSPLVDVLGTNLGVPLIHHRITFNTYQNVVDKVQTDSEHIRAYFIYGWPTHIC